MTWTYNVTTLSTTPKDQVRLLIGDTKSTDQQLQDEEILYLLSQRGSVYGTCALCCDSLAAYMSRLADTTTGELHTLYSSRAKAYAARAANFESLAVMLGGAQPLVGGISITDKQNAENDPDRVPPEFNRDMMDNWTQPVAPAGNETGVPIVDTNE